MSVKMNVAVYFHPAQTARGFDFKSPGLFDTPAQWELAVDFVEDDNHMTASIHQIAFAAKPTKKQIRAFIKKAKAEHASDLVQFKIDYPGYFDSEQKPMNLNHASIG